MSQKYDEYLHEHISNVNRAGEWMIDHGIIPRGTEGYFRFRLSKHDESKRDSREYDAYDEYFYGKGKEDPATKEAFDYAWLQHIHLNPHHWQHWVLINDEDGTIAMDIPEEFVYEMIADWWSFSWKTGDLKTIFDWYAEHSPKMILSEKTRELVDKTLDRIDAILTD